MAAACMIMMFLHISLYFVLLLLAQPFLRRHLRAGSCALLWLTPNYLYLAMSSDMTVPPPVGDLPAPGGGWKNLAGVWLAGSTGGAGLENLFPSPVRRWLLRGRWRCPTRQSLAVWQAELEWAGERSPSFVW